MVKIVRRTQSAEDVDIAAVFEEWQILKEQAELLEGRMDLLKAQLTDALESQGYTDDRGHLWLDFPESVHGFKSLKWELRISQSLNKARAESLLREKDLYEQCIVMVPTLDEDEVLLAHANGLLSAEEIDAMFVKRESRALKPQKG